MPDSCEHRWIHTFFALAASSSAASFFFCQHMPYSCEHRWMHMAVRRNNTSNVQQLSASAEIQFVSERIGNETAGLLKHDSTRSMIPYVFNIVDARKAQEHARFPRDNKPYLH
jgi:hypothetical protein